MGTGSLQPHLLTARKHGMETTIEKLRVHRRWMIRRDMAEVMEIESQSFEHPWTEEEFVKCLRQRNSIGRVAEHDERIVGFWIYELHASRIQLINLAVHPDFRRRGIGRQMTEELIGKLSSHRRTRISLEVRESNVAAQVFFRAARFRAVNVIGGFYEDSDEAAILFVHRHQSHATEAVVKLQPLPKRKPMSAPTTFPSAIKVDPIFRIADKLYRKVSNADGQKDASAIRATTPVKKADGSEELKVNWFVPLEVPTTNEQLAT